MTVVNDRSERVSHKVDVVVGQAGRILAIGAAKLREVTVADVDRLRAIRDLLPGAEGAGLLIVFSASRRVPT